MPPQAIVLLLIITANSTPVVLARLLKDRAAWPIDGNWHLRDGHPLFGPSKTWRGLLGAVLACAILAPLLGSSVLVGAAAGALAMTGDMLSSFTKRRLGLASSSRASLIDQIPESLLPALVLQPVFQLSVLGIAEIVLTFIILEMVFSVIFFRLGLRKRPY